MAGVISVALGFDGGTRVAIGMVGAVGRGDDRRRGVWGRVAAVGNGLRVGSAFRVSHAVKGWRKADAIVA